MRHLTLQQLSATVDQALSGVSLELVRRHLEECEECRARGSKLARVDGVVAQLVSHDPGDAWLEAVAVEIDERVRAEVAGRFDPPAHPAGPPPLEFVAAPPAADELEKLWEEGSTTPRPSSLKPRETAEESPGAAASEAVPAAPKPPLAGDPAVHRPPPAPPDVAKGIVVVKSASAPKPAPAVKTPEPKVVAPPAPRLAPPAPLTPVAAPAPPTPVAPTAAAPKVAPVAPTAAAPKPAPVAPTSTASKPAPPVARPAEVRPPAPAAKTDGGEVLAPAATTRVPPLRRRVPDGESPMGWGPHADRVVRARREATNAQREAFLPLAFGLVGGALAGAFVVTLFFLRHGGAGSAPVAPVAHVASSPAPAAAIQDPVARAEVESVTAKEEPVVTPSAGNPAGGEAATTATGVPPSSTVPAAVKAPATPSTVTPPASAPARPSRARTAPAAVARAIPTGEESWPLLCGEVVDESGAPVTGARILLADLDVGARTDRRGRFCLAAPSGDRTLSVVALGFVTQRRAVSVASGAADVHIVLKATP